MFARARQIYDRLDRSNADAVLLILLSAFETWRTLRHAMWRDEMQAFMLAAASASPVELFANLKYEGHPGLWHLLLWIVTRFTADPVAMQFLHVAITLSVWLLICRFSPFTIAEKVLLVLGYFLFWEYFVVSRSYVLMALLGFGFIVLRSSWPRQQFIAWFILGLLANTFIFGTIWSMVLGALYFVRVLARSPPFLAGAALYAALLALAVLTMSRTEGESIYSSAVHFDLEGFSQLISYPVEAFAPNLDIGKILTPIYPQSHILQVALLALPIAACWLVVRNVAMTLPFAATYFGVLLFAQLWHFIGGLRHFGIVFLAFVGAVWTSRAEPQRARRISWLWLAIVALNAAGGLQTLSIEPEAYSRGRAVAQWLQGHGLRDAFIIGSPTTASTVAGYLMRPFYYLECECRGTYTIWNSQRQARLPAMEVMHRIERGMESSGQKQAIVILPRELTQEQRDGTPNLQFDLQATFTGANYPGSRENFAVYRASSR